MAVATVRPFMTDALPRGHFIYDVLLLQLELMLLFAVFFGAGFLKRRQAGTHKRLMVLSMVALLQAAVDRMHWLPGAGVPKFVYLYALLIPLFAFDFVSLRRIHPITLVGTGIMIAGHVAIVIVFIFAHAWWQDFAHAAINIIR